MLKRLLPLENNLRLPQRPRRLPSENKLLVLELLLRLPPKMSKESPRKLMPRESLRFKLKSQLLLIQRERLHFVNN